MTTNHEVVALRTVGPVLIELPTAIPAGHRAWVASIWPSPDLAGWGRELWRHDPVRRGWIIPASCTHGTIVEVGATIERRRRRRTHTAWYAIAIAHDQHWLICTNPYPGPGEAHQHARQLTDCYRRGIIEQHRTSTTPEPDTT